MDRKPDLEIETRFGFLNYFALMKELEAPERGPRRPKMHVRPEHKPKSRLKFRGRAHKPCPCGEHRWTIVRDHSHYRDPFLSCQGCRSTFRMNRTPLDLQYAWRDGIPMPEEVTHRDHPDSTPPRA